MVLADIEFQAEATALIDKAIKDGVAVIQADEVKTRDTVLARPRQRRPC